MLVSVVLPTYNRAGLLERSVRSVLAQTFSDFELIIVDDGSTDGTAEAVRKLQKGDPRIRYIRHEKNRGEASSRNTGIRAAQGMYIANHDSDDAWLPRKLEKQLQVFRAAPPSVGVVYTGMNISDPESRPLYFPSASVKQRDGDLREILINGNFIGCPTTLIKKECFAECGLFDTGLRHYVDFEMWLRIARHYEFRIVDEPLVEVHMQPDSVSRDKSEQLRASRIILERYRTRFRMPGPYRADTLRCLAQAALDNGDMRLARRWLLEAFIAFPRRLKYLLLCLFPGSAMVQSPRACVESVRPLVGVIVVNHDGTEMLMDCLEALGRQTYANFFVIAVDNGSRDNPSSVIRSRFPSTELISLDRNLGFAKANNLGIRRALSRSADFVCLLNNDAVPAEDWLKELVLTAQGDTEIGSCQSKIVNADGSAIDSLGIWLTDTGEARQYGYGRKDSPAFRENKEIFGGCAAALLLRKTMLADIGLFDEHFFACFEDVELALRQRRRGWKCVYVASSVVYHRHSATLRRMGNTKEFLLVRNRYLYLLKHFPMRTLARALRGQAGIFVRRPRFHVAAAHASAFLLAPAMLWQRFRMRPRFAGFKRLEAWLPAYRFPEPASKDLSICIVNWNTRELLRRCLSSIREGFDGIGLEVIVVDNGSSDASAEMVARDFPGVILIRNASNRGFTAGTNQAIRASRGRYVFLLNSDIEVANGGLQRLVGRMERDPGVAVLSCALTHFDGSLQHFCYRFPTIMTAFFEKTFLQRFFPGNRFLKRYYMEDWAHDSFREVDQPPGCCLLFRREVLEATGLLDENMFLFFSDVDICLRVKKAGLRIFFTPDVRFSHGLGSSVRKLEAADSHWFGDKMYYYRKHYGIPAVAAVKIVLAADFLLRSAELLCYGRPGETRKYLRLLVRVVCA